MSFYDNRVILSANLCAGLFLSTTSGYLCNATTTFGEEVTMPFSEKSNSFYECWKSKINRHLGEMILIENVH